MLGGDSQQYVINGPHSLQKSFTSFSVGFEVVVIADDPDTLKTLSDALELDMRKRDQDLVFTLNGVSSTYTFGTTALNTTASIAKRGDPNFDKGASRIYTCSIECELPASDQNGLRDLSVETSYSASNQRTVTMTGTYTVHGSNAALAAYKADFPVEATTILTALDPTASFEQISESHTQDRVDHTCTFRRVYVELLADQSTGLRDSPFIADHKLTFSDIGSYPGDSLANTIKLRRVHATFSASIVKGFGMYTVKDSIISFITEAFRGHFNPSTFGVEEDRYNFDDTTNQFSANITYVYSTANGLSTVEVSSTTITEETFHHDFTPTHSGNEFSFNVDKGWTIKTRTNTDIVMSLEAPDKKEGRFGFGGS
ncbi:hypothetical protein KDA14_04940, partial [Candidatus Saccharibacteria bacterium]|nr:hypothetical protein [Candidatus Saccharibacteria bacterium]